VTSKRRPVETGRTSVKKPLPPQAMSEIRLGMRGLVRSYVTLAIIIFVHTPNVLCYVVPSYHVLVTTRHLRLFDCLLTFLY
jgi:hypothetical protein